MRCFFFDPEDVLDDSCIDVDRFVLQVENIFFMVGPAATGDFRPALLEQIKGPRLFLALSADVLGA